MKRKLIVIAILAIVVILLVWKLFKNPGSGPPKCRNCNIALIDADILRADALPCNGYYRNTAPNLCKWAKESTYFNDNYSNAIWTLPSIFSTITSRLPTFHRVRMLYKDSLSTSIPTLAETLKKRGYRTIFVTNSENTGLLSQENGGFRGYDQIVLDKTFDQVVDEIKDNPQPWFIHYYNGDLHMPFLIPDDMRPIDQTMVPPKNLPITRKDYDILLNDFIKENYKKIFKEKAIKEYATVILGPKKSKDTSIYDLFVKLNDEKLINDYLVDGWKPINNVYLNSFNPEDKSDVAYVRMMYDTNIKLLDEKLVGIINKLGEEKIAQKTISIIMSDHGETFGEHGTWFHDDGNHTELFWTPLIIHYPNVEPKKIETASSNLDIFPTILELTGGDQIDGLQGKSLVKTIENDVAEPERFVFGESGFGMITGIVIQNKKWLYFLPTKNWSNKDNSILYDKVRDKSERENATNVYPKMADQLYQQASLLHSYEEEIKTNKVFPDPKMIDLDSNKIKRLQKEGYF